MLVLTADGTRHRADAQGPGFAQVLSEDPELGAALSRDQWQLAARAALAPVFTHECGTWRFFPKPDHASLGALVLGGLIVIRVEVEGRAHVELLGEGDVISPWAGVGTDLSVPSAVTACVVSELRLALLDRRFTLRVARWPEIHAALVQRLIARSRRLSMQSAINSLTRTEERLELTFWQLADRFGRVTPDGVTLNLALTHSQLAEMVSAQRPSVTVALGRLAADGRLLRQGKGRWLLRGPTPPKLSALVQQSGLRPDPPVHRDHQPQADGRCHDPLAGQAVQ